MSKSTTNQLRSLAVAPSTRGFGFAVLEGESKLVDWGVKPATGDKNSHCLAKVEKLFTLYRPAVLVLEDPKSSPRSARIHELNIQLVELAKQNSIRVKLLTRAKVRGAFFADGEGTKEALAALLAERFPEELAHRLPPKRRLWNSEAHAMGIFDAVALGLARGLPKQR